MRSIHIGHRDTTCHLSHITPPAVFDLDTRWPKPPAVFDLEGGNFFKYTGNLGLTPFVSEHEFSAVLDVFLPM